ncbi:MAG: serine/threonine-protein kinase, partial [Planctomycetota bacterium]
REVLGEGGFGVVYLAEQLEPVRRSVALKVIKPGMDSRSVVGRFQAERQALAVMDHPNVAKVFDGGTVPAGEPGAGRPYFVMEYVPGEHITRFCDTERLSIDERLRIFMQVCDAVQHAHTKGVVHRDLKPSNILVSRVDDAWLVKVIDFGVAKALHEDGLAGSVETVEGQLLGTPEYMSPEQASETAVDIDTRADIYAMGVLLYELLTGARPFESSRLRSRALPEVLRLIRDEEPPRPSTRLFSLGARSSAGRGETSGTILDEIAATRRTQPRALASTLRRDLDWVVMKCLEKDRERRYATCRELREELGRFLRREAVLAGPPSVRYRMQKLLRRHRGPVIAAGVVAATLILGVVGTTVGFVEAREQAVSAELAAARADDEARASAQISAFLWSAFEVAAPGNIGPGATVLDQLAWAESQVDERFESDPVLASRVDLAIENAYYQIGDKAGAVRVARRAVERLRGELGRGDPMTVDATIVLANDLAEAGDPAAAIDELEPLTREVMSSDMYSAATKIGIWHDLGVAYREVDRLDDASNAVTLGLGVLGAGATPKGDVVRFRLLAMRVAMQRGDETLGEEIRALEAAALEAFDADDPSRSMVLLNAGRAYIAAGQWPEAVELLTGVIDDAKEALGADFHRLPLMQQQLSRALRGAGRASEAETVITDAIEIAETHGGASGDLFFDRALARFDIAREGGGLAGAEVIVADLRAAAERAAGLRPRDRDAIRRSLGVFRGAAAGPIVAAAAELDAALSAAPDPDE